MSDRFDFKRALLLVRRQWISFGRIYLMSLAIIAGVFLCFYGFNVRDYFIEDIARLGTRTDILDFRMVLFVFLGLLFVTVVGSSYFADLGQKTKAIFELMIPASRLEKFTVALFYMVFVSIGTYLLLFLLIDYTFVSYLRSIGSSTTTYMQDGKTIVIDHWAYFFKQVWPKNFFYFVFLPFLLNAIFLLGSIAFRNFQYIKTAILLVVYVAAWVLCFVSVMIALTRDTVQLSNDGYWENEQHVFGLFLWAGTALTFIFWGLAFLRLKEKEV